MQKKSVLERVFHAVGFEVIAVGITAPAAAWIMGRSVWQMGTLA
ncbi:MAG: Na(+)-translocating NADH-quinone reductase subunit E, partial [Budvicia sp.]|nr:Na(+)-translocating NADH-quinone reductase subunit E [Budvicia sp.]